ncbi:MAG: CapA family protein [Chloroflexia bacterium]|nr:CapA family protein [Chloroflexia bacterium]
MNRARAKSLAAIVLLAVFVVTSCAHTTSPAPTNPPPTGTPTTVPSTAPPPATPEPSNTPLPARPLGLSRIWRMGAQDIIWEMGCTDLEADGRREVWAISYDQHFYVLDQAGQIRWTFAAGAPIFAGLAQDLDGDRQPEFLLGGDANSMYALDAAGNPLWSTSTTGRVTHLAYGDIDGGGESEIIAATWDDKLYVLDAAGQEKRTLPLPGRPNVLRLADLDGDGQDELLLGLESNSLLALDGTGEVLWQHGLDAPLRDLLLLDLPQEGSPQILAASQNGQLALIEADGRPRWAQRIEGITLLTLQFLPQANQVLLGHRGGLMALNPLDGNIVWEQPHSSGIWSLAIVGSGPEPVLAAGSHSGEILLYDRWGQSRGRLQLPSRVLGLRVDDLDADGRPELLARSGDYVYAFHTAVQADADEPPPYVATMPRWPEPSPLPPVPEGHIELLFVGDLMLGRSIEARLQGYGPNYPFERLASLLQQADLTVGNLECVLAETAEPGDKAYFVRAHPDMAAGLDWAGFDLINLANDHSLDYGQAGLEETLATLDQLGIESVGAGEQAREPVIMEAEGIRVAFLARNAVGQAQDNLAWFEDEDTLRQEVQQAHRQADVVVLLLHAGQDFSAEITWEQRWLAEAAAEAGADLVIGYQSHFPQDPERYGDSLIAYGLGDFVFDIDIVDAARDGAILRVVLTKDGPSRADWIATRIVDDAQPQPVAAPGGRIETYPLFVNVSEPLPSPPANLPLYVLDVDIDPESGQVQVQQEIGFPNTSGDELAEIALFVYPNATSDTFFLRNAAVTQRAQTTVPSYTLSETTLKLFLTEPLPPGEVLSITLDYALSLPALGLLDWPPYGNLGYDPDGRAVHLGHWYPQLVPYRAGYGWQTWDYHPVGDPFYIDLAGYRVRVQAPDDYVVVGSGERQALAEGWAFRIDAARDFALFLGRDYVESSKEKDGIQIHSVYRQEHAQSGQAVLDMAQQALSLYQEIYGPYPYDVLTMFEGDMNGGMEYSSLVLIGTAFYADYQGHPQSILPGLTVHELAHQWWYGVVGNDQVHEPWLDEAMARYSELLFYERYYPDSVDWWWETRIDRWNPSGPVDVSIYDYDDSATYVHNLYGRAAHFMQDLRQRLGSEAYFDFLQRYYRENAWQRVSRNDFFRALEQETGVNVDDLVELYFRD